MKKILALVIILTVTLIGCASEEDRVISKLKSEMEGKYSIVIFNDMVPSGEYQSRINNDLIDGNKLGKKFILYRILF